MTEDLLRLGDFTCKSRLFIGTGKFGSIAEMKQAVAAAQPSLVTVALKRFDLNHPEEDIYSALREFADITIMPNTSGAKNRNEAYQAAHIGRELSGSRFVKIEIHPDSYHLMPDPIETFYACEKLCKEGFIVMPYIQADPVLAKRLQDIGCAAVMPLGSVIGSGQGLLTAPFLKIIIAQAKVPVVVDAGIRSPSNAMTAMELGAGAVLVNTALAMATDKVLMAKAFKDAVQAGRMAYRAGIMAESKDAQATSLTQFLGIN